MRKIKQLKSGETAPQFDAKDIYNKDVSFIAQDKWTLISFHRYASCPFCVVRTHDLIEAIDEFQANDIDIISLWPSSKENMLKFIGSEKAPFPMVADIKKLIFENYGVTKSSKFSLIRLIRYPKMVWKAMRTRYKHEIIDADRYLLPAEFLVNPSGEIVIAHYGQHYADHIAVDKILRFKS
ncbi:hypothetical protein DNU06_04970 [Putridiphycobacter roseus]|uniref:Thioredoxin domain-containing protein n=1 Tax=Putridiphycobacter roseus TaxID=2219161 RepID=A0A2W1NFV8_9FLAO|nr:redoxin domain-containing protein [Putridiphycobacter roseus]PZE17973.1 hypothetical protein DNU06_04970 [Putridiphycobacter roseus]